LNLEIGGDIPLDDLSNPSQIEEEKTLEEQESADELKFYMNQIYRIIKPVVVCIILSIFWVKVSFGGQSDYR
jgi:presenilin 1